MLAKPIAGKYLTSTIVRYLNIPQSSIDFF